MKQSKQKTITIIATASLVALLYFFVDARTAAFFPPCPLYKFTGLLCPGCGSQRALSSLLHGDLVEALSFNVLMVLSLPLVAYSALITTINTFREKPITQPVFYSVVFAKALLLVVLIFGITRNIDVYPFNLLAPH